MVTLYEMHLNMINDIIIMLDNREFYITKDVLNKSIFSNNLEFAQEYCDKIVKWFEKLVAKYPEHTDTIINYCDHNQQFILLCPQFKTPVSLINKINKEIKLIDCILQSEFDLTIRNNGVITTTNTIQNLINEYVDKLEILNFNLRYYNQLKFDYKRFIAITLVFSQISNHRNNTNLQIDYSESKLLQSYITSKLKYGYQYSLFYNIEENIDPDEFFRVFSYIRKNNTLPRDILIEIL